jgi:hypothetical protein
MAKRQTGTSKPGLTRGKASLIGVLAVVLVAVLYVQYGRYGGGSSNDSTESLNARAPTSRAVPAAQPVSSDKQIDGDNETQAALLEFDQTKWKPPELSKVIAYDPFALPAGFPQPRTASLNATEDDDATAEEKSKQLADALADLRMQLDELKERGVHVIVGQKDQYVAMIGDRMIHVGDEINGFTVTEIDPKDGVRVERKTVE